MTLSFKYKLISRPDPVGESHAPMIPLLLKGDKKAVSVLGLLDSGADFTVIPKDLAEYLGLDLSSKREKVRGIGSVLEAIPSKVIVVVQKGHEAYSLRVRCKVIESLDEDLPVLLGRIDFFQNFSITIDESGGTIKLKKNNILGLR